MDRPGAVADAAARRSRASSRDHAAGDDRWCVALSGGAGLAGADRGRRDGAADHRADRRPPSAARLGDGRGRRRATRRSPWDALTPRFFASTSAPRAARRPRPARPATRALDEARARRAGAAGAHARRPGRDGAARPGPRARAPARSPACGRTTRRGAGRCSGCGASVTQLACAELGLTPWQDPHNADRALHPGAAAHRGAAAARGRTRRRRRRGAGPHRDRAARGQRHARRAWPTKPWPGSATGGRPAHRRAGRAARGGPAQGDQGLAAGRRRERPDRQADPRRRRVWSPPGGARAGWRWIPAAQARSGCSPAAATEVLMLYREPV